MTLVCLEVSPIVHRFRLKVNKFDILLVAIRLIMAFGTRITTHMEHNTGQGKNSSAKF